MGVLEPLIFFPKYAIFEPEKMAYILLILAYNKHFILIKGFIF